MCVLTLVTVASHLCVHKANAQEPVGETRTRLVARTRLDVKDLDLNLGSSVTSLLWDHPQVDIPFWAFVYFIWRRFVMRI